MYKERKAQNQSDIDLVSEMEGRKRKRKKPSRLESSSSSDDDSDLPSPRKTTPKKKPFFSPIKLKSPVKIRSKVGLFSDDSNPQPKSKPFNKSPIHLTSSARENLFTSTPHHTSTSIQYKNQSNNTDPNDIKMILGKQTAKIGKFITFPFFFLDPLVYFFLRSHNSKLMQLILNCYLISVGPSCLENRSIITCMASREV